MSYCRKGPDSDCYIIGTGDGYECLCCTLTEELTLPGGSKMHDSFYCRTPTELYHHMLDHVMRGEKVPLSAMERAKAEEEGRVWVDPELVLLELLERLTAPQMAWRMVDTRTPSDLDINPCIEIGGDGDIGYFTCPHNSFEN